MHTADKESQDLRPQSVEKIGAKRETWAYYA